MLKPLASLPLLFAGLLLAVPVVHADKPANVLVEAAWISEAPPTARNNAAYVRLKNGARQDTLIGVSTPVAAVAELHELRQEGGVTRMQQLKAVELAPGQELEFAPGGRHIMLIDMRRPLKAGERVPLTLKFRRAGTVTVQAEVRPLPVEEDHSHHHHH
ncbi:MAG: hypothetical protein K0S46_1633 [Moraxellaceae bacterium]|nr:hypothetical protein [Moraxellaceae bacterium]